MYYIILQMAFLLNYGEFYERLRDLLQNNHPVTKYKFGNKVNGAMKDFDNFLENTVKRYMDAFNSIQFVKAENVQLRVLIDRLKTQIKDLNCEQDFLRLHLDEKDAKCQQLIRQKDKLHELFLYTTNDNPVLLDAKRLKFQLAELKQENSKLRANFQLQKSRAEIKQEETLEQRKILEQQLSRYVQNCRKLEKELQQQMAMTEKTIRFKVEEQRKGWQQEKVKQQAAWMGKMQSVHKKMELWKKRYYEQVGFVALVQESEDTKAMND